jgi:hypothetical protein
MPIPSPTNPKLDRWLRKQPPRVELALRYSIRGRFDDAKASRAFNARVDELFAVLKPGEDELAAIVRHAREIGQAIDGSDWVAENCCEATLSSPRLALAIAGCLGWLEFALNYAAERWNLLPWIGWGLGHYVAFVCAIGGTALLLAALLVKPRIEFPESTFAKWWGGIRNGQGK